MFSGVDRIVNDKIQYMNHLQRISRIGTKTTKTTQDIIRHQKKLYEIQKMKDVNRMYMYKKKMNNMLLKNKKIFGNLAKIIQQKDGRSYSVKEKVNNIEKARIYMRRNKQRARVSSLMSIERKNGDLARKIASAKKSINFKIMEDNYRRSRAYNKNMRRFTNKGSKLENKANKFLMNTAFYNKVKRYKGSRSRIDSRATGRSRRSRLSSKYNTYLRDSRSKKSKTFDDANPRFDLSGNIKRASSTRHGSVKKTHELSSLKASRAKSMRKKNGKGDLEHSPKKFDYNPNDIHLEDEDSDVLEDLERNLMKKKISKPYETRTTEQLISNSPVERTEVSTRVRESLQDDRGMILDSVDNVLKQTEKKEKEKKAKSMKKRIQFLKGKAARAEVYDNHHRDNAKSAKKNKDLDHLFLN